MDKHDREVLGRLNLRDPLQLIAVGFGSGLMPKAPGTMGSLLALPLCMLLVYADPLLLLGVIVLTFLVGTLASSHTEKVMGMHDNSAIVIDEIVGMFISVAFYPQCWWYTPLAFVLFRIFDILKPFPISYLDRRISGGLGIMLDDVAAGMCACLSAQVIFWALGIS
ncbi:MAG: phosphatidylglycerophosphatase A [Succinivibrio sp.]|nr:phosphatidylglycerophosphatase A [Succinivibrio sp.]